MLWMGTLGVDQRLSVIAYQLVYEHLGSALAFSARGKLVVANCDLYNSRCRAFVQLVRAGIRVGANEVWSMRSTRIRDLVSGAGCVTRRDRQHRLPGKRRELDLARGEGVEPDDLFDFR